MASQNESWSPVDRGPPAYGRRQADLLPMVPRDESLVVATAQARHWVAVYTELVEFAGECGVDGERFRDRLTHWEQVMAELTAPGPRIKPGPVLRRGRG